MQEGRVSRAREGGEQGSLHEAQPQEGQTCCPPAEGRIGAGAGTGQAWSQSSPRYLGSIQPKPSGSWACQEDKIGQL